MIYGTTESPADNDEILAVEQNARMRFRLWLVRALYSTGALIVSCALVYPFLDGHSLHAYWDSFGKYLTLLSTVLLLLFVYCVGTMLGRVACAT